MIPFIKITCTYLFFAVFHSVCAHEEFKSMLEKIAGSFFVKHLWRAIYCGISFYLYFSFYPSILFHETIHFNQFYFSFPHSHEVTLLLRLLGTIIVYIAFFQSDYLEFTGIKQIYRGLRTLMGKPEKKENLFGTQRLEVKGIYRFIRHPMLAGGWLVLLPSTLNLPHLINIVFFTLYMIIGKYFEDKRLEKVFGDSYLKYKNEVGAFFPRLWNRHAIIK